MTDQPGSTRDIRTAGAPQFIATQQSGYVIVWQPGQAIELPAGACSWALSPDGTLLAIGFASGEARVLHAGTGAVISAHQVPSLLPVTAIAFAPGQRLLLVGTCLSEADGLSEVMLFAIGPGAPAPESICRLPYAIDRLALSANNLLLAIGAHDAARTQAPLSLVTFYRYCRQPVRAPYWEPTRSPLYYEGPKVAALWFTSPEAATVMFTESAGVTSVEAVAPNAEYQRPGDPAPADDAAGGAGGDDAGQP